MKKELFGPPAVGEYLVISMRPLHLVISMRPLHLVISSEAEG